MAKAVSQLMSQIVVRGGFNVWPDLLKFLSDNLQLQIDSVGQETFNSAILENSMATISIIVEDCNEMLKETKYEALVTQMFPPICKLINTQYSEEVVASAINTINMLLLSDAEIVIKNTDEYFAVLLNLGLQVSQL